MNNAEREKLSKKDAKRAEMNWIYSYYQAIKENKVTVGKWIELLYERIIKGIQNKEYVFDQKKANAAVKWIEKSCFHTEGPKAPQNLNLELWQKAFVSAIFGIVDPKGIRQFREVVLIVARKNGKSLLMSAIAKYTWYIDGGYGARIYCLAPKLEQAEIIYGNVWQMVELDPEYQELKEALDERDEHNKRIKDISELPKRRQSDLMIPKTNSTVKKIAFSAKKSDGFNPSLTICDEIASWEGDKGLKQYEVMKSGMGARPEGLLISCSTSGYVNDSIYDELLKRATRFLLGDGKEKRLLPFLYMVDDIDKWNDINELAKSNPNLGVSVMPDYLIEEIAIAEGSLSKKAEFIVKYCNLKQTSSQAWLGTKTVDRNFSNQPISEEILCDSYCVFGLDLSRTTDLTAAVILVQRDDKINVISHFWMPQEKIEEATARDNLPYKAYVQKGFLTLAGDNFVDYHAVYDWIIEQIETRKLYCLQFGYDRYSAQYLIDDLKSYGIHVDDVYQGFNLTSVIDTTEGFMKDGKFDFGDNDLMKIHLLNSAMKVDTEQNKRKLIKISATSRIDGTAALLDAMCVRQKWWSDIGVLLENKE